MGVLSYVGASRLASGEPAGTRGAAAQGHPTLYPKHIVRRLTAEQRLAFGECRMCALWIAGNLDGPQARRLGDNRGAWPIDMGLTQRWSGLTEDNQFADSDPNEKRGVMLRFWCDSYDVADRLQCAVYRHLKELDVAEAGLGSWLNLVPQTTLADVSAHILNAAARMGIETLTDDEMIRHLDGVIAMARACEGRGGR